MSEQHSSNNSVFVNSLLCFLWNYVDKVTTLTLSDLVSRYFTPEEICEAESSLSNYVDDPTHIEPEEKQSVDSPSRLQRLLDLVQHAKSTDFVQDLPVFAAADLRTLPLSLVTDSKEAASTADRLCYDKILEELQKLSRTLLRPHNDNKVINNNTQEWCAKISKAPQVSPRSEEPSPTYSKGTSSSVSSALSPGASRLNSAVERLISKQTGSTKTDRGAVIKTETMEQVEERAEPPTHKPTEQINVQTALPAHSHLGHILNTLPHQLRQLETGDPAQLLRDPANSQLLQWWMNMCSQQQKLPLFGHQHPAMALPFLGAGGSPQTGGLYPFGVPPTAATLNASSSPVLNDSMSMKSGDSPTTNQLDENDVDERQQSLLVDDDVSIEGSMDLSGDSSTNTNGDSSTLLVANGRVSESPSHKAQGSRSNRLLDDAMDKPHRCTWQNCNKSFANKFLLKKHVFIHTGERPHECPYCHKRFNRKDNLLRHKKTHLANAMQARRRHTLVFPVPGDQASPQDAGLATRIMEQQAKLDPMPTAESKLENALMMHQRAFDPSLLLAAAAAGSLSLPFDP